MNINTPTFVSAFQRLTQVQSIDDLDKQIGRADRQLKRLHSKLAQTCTKLNSQNGTLQDKVSAKRAYAPAIRGAERVVLILRCYRIEIYELLDSGKPAASLKIDQKFL